MTPSLLWRLIDRRLPSMRTGGTPLRFDPTTFPNDLRLNFFLEFFRKTNPFIINILVNVYLASYHQSSTIMSLTSNQSVAPFLGKRMSFIRGLDPMGLQNASERTYSKLLQGLSNVTN